MLMLDIGFVFGSLGMAHAAADKVSLETVKNDVAKAAESIKRYSADQRDEALDKAKADMDSLDTKIDRLQSSIDGKWDKMDTAARRRVRMTLDELHEQRRRLGDSYAAMKESSVGAWSDVKKGFSDSYEKVHEAWNKAEEEFKISK